MSLRFTKLYTFTWKGKSKSDITLHGEMTAVNPTVVAIELRRQGINPTKIRKKKKALLTSKQSINSTDIILFTRHLATMISAGLPLVQSLRMIAKGTKKTRMAAVIKQIKNDIAEGMSFATSLSKHSNYFDHLFCNLIQTAEISGTLDTMLNRIVDYLEKTETIKKNVKKALTYPIAVLMVTFTVTVILLMFVVPQFETLFGSFNAKLPAFTRFTISLSTFLKNFWWLIISGIFTSIYSFINLRKHSKKFHDLTDQLVLRLPILGTVINKTIISRSTRTLSTTLTAGIPLLYALQSVATISGNVVFHDAFLKINDDIKTGKQLNIAMSNTHVFPNLVIQMVAVGEESGEIESMLDKIATIYEKDVENLVSHINTLIEPILMIILGLLVGSFVLSMYLPIFKLGSIF